MKIKDHFLTQEEFELVETDFPGIYTTVPSPSNLAKYYESDAYISHHQDKNTLKEIVYKFLQSFNLKYKKKIILDSLSDKKINLSTLKLLDYGCGAGEFLKCIEKNFECFGFEPNSSALQQAMSKTNKVRFIDSIEAIPNNSLDFITLWHVLEHLEEPFKSLEIFNSKLKPTGKLILALPNYQSYDAKYYKEYWAAYDVPRHQFHFSRLGLLGFFYENMFWKLNEIKPLFLDSFYVSILSEKYLKNNFFWIKGGFLGAISNFKAIKTGDFSSLIYVVEKK